MTMRSGVSALLIIAALGLVSGCESSKDKATRHFNAALELLQKGDQDRAIVEFRNVFKLDPENHDARMAFAKLLEKRGSQPEALAQYRKVADASPNDAEALQGAARMAANIGDWQSAGTYAKSALALQATNPDMLAVQAAVDYATAVRTADPAKRQLAADAARALLVKQPGNILLNRVVIDSFTSVSNFKDALSAADAAIVAFPKEQSFYLLRVAIYSALQDDKGVEAALLQSIAAFPEDAATQQMLVRWYVAHKQLDQAEAFMRGRAKSGDSAIQLSLVDFLRQYRSVDSALAEIDKMLAAMPATTAPDDTAVTPDTKAADAKAADAGPPPVKITPDLVRALRASIVFDQGKQAEAVKSMQDILATAKVSDESRRIKITLARMQFTMGDPVHARALVEEVLAEDAGQVDALKIKAAWLIDDDKTDDAVALLRAALDANPRDPVTMTMMAQAYQRAGNPELTADMLSQAVVASGKAPAETMRYAEFLMSTQKYLAAETLLTDALRLDPTNVALLSDMGKLYVKMKDWPRATGVADRLDELATPDAVQASHILRPGILAGQQRIGDAIEYLKGLTSGADANLNAQATLIQAYLANGEPDKATALAQSLLEKSPDNPNVRFIMATVQGAVGDGAVAEATFTDLLKQDPKRLIVWTALIGQLAKSGKTKEATAAVEDGLKALPDSGDLLLIRANFLEQSGDNEGAIAVYDKLYTGNTSNMIIANNLASMLANYRTDADSLDKAYRISRRLAGTQEPVMADTYGWITYLHGSPSDSVPYLETAAAGLPKDPMVQFHLAEAYRALKRDDDAKAQYFKVLALVPPGDNRPFVETSRKGSEGKIVGDGK